MIRRVQLAESFKNEAEQAEAALQRGLRRLAKDLLSAYEKEMGPATPEAIQQLADYSNAAAIGHTGDDTQREPPKP